MKKSKLFIIIIIFILLMLGLSSHFIINAESDIDYIGDDNVGYGNVKSIREFCKLTWDDVKELTFGENIWLRASRSSKEGELCGSDLTDKWGHNTIAPRNSMCFHRTSFDENEKVTEETVNNNETYTLTKLSAIIDVDSDGNCFITKANGRVKLDASSCDTYVKELAVYCAKISEANEKCNGSVSSYYEGGWTKEGNEYLQAKVDGTYRSDFWRIYYNISNIFNTEVASFEEPERKECPLTEEGKYAGVYSGSYTCEPTIEVDKNKTYRGRIFLFYTHDDLSGGVQDRAFIFGSEEDSESVSIDKYVTKVDYLESYQKESTELNDIRSYDKLEENCKENYKEEKKDVEWIEENWSERYKKENPVEIDNGNVTVYYTIKVKNNNKSKPVTGKLTDIYDDTLFEKLEIDGNGSFKIESNTNLISVKDNNGNWTNKITIPAGGEKIFKIKLTGKANNEIYSGEYYNTAKFTTYKSDGSGSDGSGIGDGDEDGGENKKYESSDYVEINPKEEVQLDKYITKIEYLGPFKGEGNDYGIDRSKEKLSESNTEEYKKSNPVNLKYGNVKIYYTIKIKNKGSIKLVGNIKDEFNEEFLSIIQNSNIPNGKVEISAGEEGTYNFVLKGNYKVLEGEYENKAIFDWHKIDGSKETVTSSDWVKVEAKEEILIDKYITEIDYGDPYYDNIVIPEENGISIRANKTNGYKQNNPVEVKHGNITVHYKIRIKNNGTIPETGKLIDLFDTSFFSNLQSDLPSDYITIAVGEEKTFDVTLNGNYNVIEGKYKNNASFQTYIFDENGEEVPSYSYFSEDYVEVKPIEEVKIDKYITKVEDLGTDDEDADIILGTDRKDKTDEEKKQNPVETAHKNVKITYVITMTNTGSIPVEGVFTDKFDAPNLIGRDYREGEYNASATER